MRQQLISYVDLLFADAANAEDIKQEILQNTLDRYDDLLEQGKSPQAAYSLAISGIGDISELLDSSSCEPAPLPAVVPPAEDKNRKLMQAVAIGMYICCVIPLIVLANVGFELLGLVMMFLLIAAATVLIILSGDSGKDDRDDVNPRKDPRFKTIDKTISTIGLCLYFIVSFATGAWYITWLIFLITPAIKGLIHALMDLKEGQ